MALENTIDVLVSTYGSRIYQLSNVLHDIKPNIRYIVCHQNHNLHPAPHALIDRSDVVYIKSDTVGVTKSRNILLDSASSDIIYFCDDDVILVDKFDELLRKYHQKFSDDVILFSIKDSEGRFRKNYPTKSLIKTRKNILSVGTIEISLKRNVSLPRFPEDIGAGTPLPVGDEAIFLSNFLNQGKSIRFVPETIAIHPYESTGFVASKASIYSRGVTLKRVFGLSSYLLALLFFFRRKKLFTLEEGTLTALSVFMRGVFNGK